MRESAQHTQRRLKIFPEEFLRAKRDIIDFVLQELKKVENYWNFRYRYMNSIGLRPINRSQMEVEETDGGVVIHLHIEVGLPNQLFYDVALARKRRRLRLPRLHPTIRQKLREADELAAEIEEEISKDIERLELGEGDEQRD